MRIFNVNPTVLFMCLLCTDTESYEANSRPARRETTGTLRSKMTDFGKKKTCRALCSVNSCNDISNAEKPELEWFVCAADDFTPLGQIPPYANRMLQLPKL